MAKFPIVPPVREAAPGRKEKVCPISAEQFAKDAKPVGITVNGIPMVAVVKQYATGSFGWYLNGKTAIDVGGVPVEVQIGCNLTVVGSKKLAEKS